jgi:hypothetical protein
MATNCIDVGTSVIKTIAARRTPLPVRKQKCCLVHLVFPSRTCIHDENSRLAVKGPAAGCGPRCLNCCFDFTCSQAIEGSFAG